MKKEQMLFEESQGFNQWWIWAIILGAMGVSIYINIQTIQMADSLFNWTNFSLIISRLILFLKA
jgi:hypothetical protein